MTPPDEIPEEPRPPAAPARMPNVGDVLAGRYKLLQRIASGGTAEVFEAEHHVTRRHVAVKVLRPEARGEGASVERFFREASACAGIDSDHIVAVHDCDVDPATEAPFLVMELLQGKDLSRFIADTLSQGTPVPPSLAMNLLKQVASALDKVHARGIVHRDLKPANLFLSFPSDGPPRVKVLDFGIARVSGDGNATRPGRVGTPLYMSAEQLDVRAQITSATDVWSFALIAYELLVGHPYWIGNTALTLYTRIPDASAHPRATELAVRYGVHLPRAFDGWLQRCLDPDPTRRPATVGEALGDLLRLYDPKATQPPARASSPSVPAVRAGPRPPPPRMPRGSVPPPRVATAPAPPPASASSESAEDVSDADIEEIEVTELTARPAEPAVRRRRVRSHAPTSVDHDDDDRRPTIPLAPVFSALQSKPAPAPPLDEALVVEGSADERATAVTLALRVPATAKELRVVETVEEPSPEPLARTDRDAFDDAVPLGELDVEPVLDLTTRRDADDAKPTIVRGLHAPPRPGSLDDADAQPTTARRVELPPVEDPEDTIGAKVAAAMQEAERERPVRRVPRSLELASTALLPATPSPSADEARPSRAVRPSTLAATAAVTIGLALAAGWVLFHHDPAPTATGAQDAAWRGPSAFEAASLASTDTAWCGALRSLYDAPGRRTGPETAHALYALVEAHRAGVALAPERQVAMLIALDRFRTPQGWTAPEHAGPDVEATASATLAYAAMTEITRAETARARVRVARDALLPLQQPDGSFDAGGGGGPDPLRGTSIAMEALLAAESADPIGNTDAVLARRRAAHVLREALGRADHPVWTAPAALDAAVAALWSDRAHAHDVEPGDALIAARYGDHLGDRCPDGRCAPVPGLDDAPWLPGSLRTAARLLRDPASMPTASQRALAVFVREGVAVLERDRARGSERDLSWLPPAVQAVSELRP